MFRGIHNWPQDLAQLFQAHMLHQPNGQKTPKNFTFGIFCLARHRHSIQRVDGVRRCRMPEKKEKTRHLGCPQSQWCYLNGPSGPFSPFRLRLLGGKGSFQRSRRCSRPDTVRFGCSMPGSTSPSCSPPRFWSPQQSAKALS